MAYTIAWGQEAEENYHAIISYLLDVYSFDVADRFTESIMAKVTLLEHSPFIGQKLKSLPGVRKSVIQPHTTLYYSIIQEQICILNVLDSRRGDVIL
ncbi:MAG: type II toxin-antitoxin system RelE/ParE family toxin [Spirosoma sp.]|nr:type II toxin-antitoxin system RelE/ParE family toxin [Spirosoma sp.]